MKDYKINPFTKFDQDWALVTAGDKKNFNSMTISWGSMGTLWHKPIITIYIRPDRYTFQFLKNQDFFTVAFFPENQREILGLMGRISGRNRDKVKESGLTPKFLNHGVTYQEAEETFLCKKIYMEQLNMDKIPQDAKKCYKENAQAHYMIIGELIEKE